MIGHAVTLSRTNSGGVVWLCECGEIGDVVPLVGASEELSARSRRRVTLTEAIAFARHGAHLNDVRADVAARSDRELARIGTIIPMANATLQRRGRWGQP